MAGVSWGKLPSLCPQTFMDQLASNGVLGLVKTVPEGCQPGSDVANLSILGYDPVKYYTGRSPLKRLVWGLNLARKMLPFDAICHSFR